MRSWSEPVAIFGAGSRKGLRITRSGEPIAAKLVEPIYAGTTIAIPEGSTVKAHASLIATAPRRKGQILCGNSNARKLDSFESASLQKPLNYDLIAFDVMLPDL